MPDAPEKSDEVQSLYEGRFIRVVKRGRWEYVERKKINGIVGIIAVTDGGKLVLIEQYRPPVDTTVIEIPAGLAGDSAEYAGEPLESAARRELLEETGYEAARFTRLSDGTSSAGITSEVITMFLAEGLKKIGAGVGDGHEQITVHEVPLAQVHAWLVAQRARGAAVDFKVFAAVEMRRAHAAGN
jgi:ADP-ribose pyrophosphatase